MANIWWDDEWKKVSTTGTATLSSYLAGVKQGLPGLGFTNIYSDETYVGGFKDNAEVTVVYVKSGKTGTWDDGTPWVETLRQVLCAAPDESTAEALTSAVVTMVNGIAFL